MNGPETGKRIEVRPPRIIVFSGAAAVVVALLMSVWTLHHLDRLTLVGFVVMPCAILLSLLSGVDALQRRFLFCGGRIEVRYLFFWKKLRVRGPLNITLSKFNQIVIEERDTSLVLLKIPREYNRRDRLRKQLCEHFGA